MLFFSVCNFPNVATIKTGRWRTKKRACKPFQRGSVPSSFLFTPACLFFAHAPFPTNTWPTPHTLLWSQPMLVSLGAHHRWRVWLGWRRNLGWSEGFSRHYSNTIPWQTLTKSTLDILVGLPYLFDVATSQRKTFNLQGMKRFPTITHTSTQNG